MVQVTTDNAIAGGTVAGLIPLIELGYQGLHGSWPAAMTDAQAAGVALIVLGVGRFLYHCVSAVMNR